MLGYENSHFPGTYSLLNLPPQCPDLLHCHSLQRGYFELEALPSLSWQIPTVLTLHDAWLLSGHCTHPFGCERWRTGCGECPDLTIPPALLRDGTAQNWQRKRNIFAASRLWIAADSKWLLEKVQSSMLSYVEARVIYPGIDLETFHPGDKLQARVELDLPPDASILLFVAHRARRNPWKDYNLLQQMIMRVREQVEGEVILLVIGDPASNALSVHDGEWLAGPVESSLQLARYYRAADIYVHATHVETFGLTLVEAMASGIPIVATRTAAIPELINDEESGFLVTPHNIENMTARVVELLKNPEQRHEMGHNSWQRSKRFDVNRTVENYLEWYHEILRQVAMDA
jgi:glycosyltransferase involved in cell wall biosynthesis